MGMEKERQVDFKTLSTIVFWLMIGIPMVIWIVGAPLAIGVCSVLGTSEDTKEDWLYRMMALGCAVMMLGGCVMVYAQTQV
jgi:hypothetical protein